MWPLFIATVLFAVVPAAHALFPEFAPGPYDVPQGVRDRAAFLWILCLAPTLSYILSPRGVRRPIPFLPIIGVLYGLYYALAPSQGLANYWARDPLLHTSATRLFDPNADFWQATDIALEGWVACMLGWRMGAWLPRRPIRKFGARLDTLDCLPIKTWAFRLACVGPIVALVDRVSQFPNAALGTVRILGFISYASIIVLIVYYRCNELTKREKAAFWALLVGSLFVAAGGGATAVVLFLLFAIFVGLWIGRRHLPLPYLIAGMLAIATCVSIRGVMQSWRAQVWWSAQSVGPFEQSHLLVRLLQHSVETEGVAGTVQAGWQVIARRSANNELLADVIRRTPLEVPYWKGDTYRSLVGAFIPRVVWPDKPTKTLGQDFGHRYSYLSRTDATTSLNLPVLVELYINFGEAGVVLGMFLVGVLFAVVNLCNLPGQSILITAAATPLLTQLFVIECDLSQQFGGLILQVVVLYALARTFLYLYGPHERSSRLELLWGGATPLRLPR